MEINQIKTLRTGRMNDRVKSTLLNFLFVIHQRVLTVWVVKAPAASGFSSRGDLQKESILVVESNDSRVGWNLENAHFLHACRLGHLLVWFNGRLVKIGFLNSLLGR